MNDFDAMPRFFLRIRIRNCLVYVSLNFHFQMHVAMCENYVLFPGRHLKITAYKFALLFFNTYTWNSQFNKLFAVGT